MSFTTRVKPTDNSFTTRVKDVGADYNFDTAYIFDDPATNFDGLPGLQTFTTRIKPTD